MSPGFVCVCLLRLQPPLVCFAVIRIKARRKETHAPPLPPLPSPPLFTHFTSFSKSTSHPPYYPTPYPHHHALGLFTLKIHLISLLPLAIMDNHSVPSFSPPWTTCFTNMEGYVALYTKKSFCKKKSCHQGRFTLWALAQGPRLRGPCTFWEKGGGKRKKREKKREKERRERKERKKGEKERNREEEKEKRKKKYYCP